MSTEFYIWNLIVQFNIIDRSITLHNTKFHLSWTFLRNQSLNDSWTIRCTLCGFKDWEYRFCSPFSVLSVERSDFNIADEPFQYPSRFYRIAKKESDYCSLPCTSPARDYSRTHRVTNKYEASSWIQLLFRKITSRIHRLLRNLVNIFKAVTTIYIHEVICRLL